MPVTLNASEKGNSVGKGSVVLALDFIGSVISKSSPQGLG